MKKVKLLLLHEDPELAALAHYTKEDHCQFFYFPQGTPVAVPHDGLLINSTTQLFRRCNSSCAANSSSIILHHVDNQKNQDQSLCNIKCDKKNLHEQNTYEDFVLDKRLQTDFTFSPIVGTSDAIKKIKRELYVIREKECKVLLSGESGTGKSIMARILHQISLRKNEKYVSVNIGALPKELIKSTLFGTVKGAFTDARDKKGLIHLAEHGTIFLDEIGELPLECQTELLHILDDGNFRKVGSEIEEHSDARFIFATNANLKELVKKKLFREDLYWRIVEFVINVPPIRERGNDIILIAQKVLQDINYKNKKKYYLGESAKQKLLNHSWPGNVRELKSSINIATIYAKSDCIEAEDIPIEH